MTHLATVVAAVALAAPLGTAAVLALRRPAPSRPQPQPDRTAELFAIPRPHPADTE